MIWRITKWHYISLWGIGPIYWFRMRDQVWDQRLVLDQKIGLLRKYWFIFYTVETARPQLFNAGSHLWRTDGAWTTMIHTYRQPSIRSFRAPLLYVTYVSCDAPPHVKFHNKSEKKYFSSIFVRNKEEKPFFVCE